MTNHRPLHTTGRTHTRMSVAEQSALHASLQPFLATPQYLANPPQPLEVELGIGNGMALYERALANPAMNFLGAEVYLNGLRTLATAMRKNPLPNLKVVAADARTLFTGEAALPPQSVQRILVLFPDPWPKTSHKKRRIIQPQLLENASPILTPHGEFWVVTDWPDYAYHAIATFYSSKAFHLAPHGLAAADCKPSARLEDAIGPQILATAPAWWQPTKYQQKGAIAGRKSWYIKAIKGSQKP
jgi:tRNA (guanine-N7-)-methyltransferase